MTLISSSFCSLQHELAALRPQVASLQQQVERARLAEWRSQAEVEQYRQILDALPYAVFCKQQTPKYFMGTGHFTIALMNQVAACSVTTRQSNGLKPLTSSMRRIAITRLPSAQLFPQ